MTDQDKASEETTAEAPRPLTKHEKRMAKHAAKREERSRPKSKFKVPKKRSTILALLPIVLLFAGFAAFAMFNNKASLAGTQYPNQGREHIGVNDPHVPYNSNPATSGPHAAAARWGVYTSEIPDEQLVHNLEHGGIVITYKPSLSNEDKEKLEEIANSFDPIGVSGITPVILVPREKNDKPVSIAAWTWAQSFETVDEEGIKKFYRDHVGKGPEPIQ